MRLRTNGHIGKMVVRRELRRGCLANGHMLLIVKRMCVTIGNAKKANILYKQVDERSQDNTNTDSHGWFYRISLDVLRRIKLHWE